MSIFDTPRLHFAGVAVASLPTGPRCGLYDLAGNRVLTADGRPFPLDRPAVEYRTHLGEMGRRGSNFGANGHFWLDARVTGWERAPGMVETADVAVGRHVDVWGHYNDYLGTTFNRARVFDIDPASNWTTTVMVGQFCFGRQGRSHDVGHMATGRVTGFQPSRWQNFGYVLDATDRLRWSVVHQFAIDTGELDWFDETEASEAARSLRSHAAPDGGLVVRFALTDLAPPEADDAPDMWRVRGTVAPWSPDEERTCPSGRLLSPRALRRSGRATPLHNAAVRVTAEYTTIDLATAVPVVRRLGPRLDVGDLELRTRDSDRLVARVPRAAYLGDTDPTGGLVTVATRADAAEPLVLVGAAPGHAPMPLLTEEETVVRVDDSARVIDDEDHMVPVRTYRLGRPAPTRLQVTQVFNPRAFPGDPRIGAETRCDDVRVVDVRSGGLAADWADSCMLATDADGRGTLAVRRATAGTTRLLLLSEGDEPPCDRSEPGSAATGYDNDDRLGYWSAVGTVDVRALPDTAHLDDIPRDEVDFAVLYREVFAPYELLYSFMRDAIFGLAEQCRVATQGQLIWRMCDPRNKDKTYYMPPSRDLTGPQARLLLAYMRLDEAGLPRPPQSTRRRAREAAITTRAHLHDALHEAAGIELAVMMQYLYAAWSIPQYGAGRELVRRGEWTENQLRLACGESEASRDDGMRGSLLTVAREEMTHFLLVNNIITAMGLPFYVPRIDFGSADCRPRVPIDLSLEGFGLGSVQRFIALEEPLAHAVDLVDDGTPPSPVGDPYRYQSIGDLYAAIRAAIRTVPDLFLVDRGRGGGEHHLFLRESVNRAHPDYQLEVDDVASALFAVDFITEQGEGNALRTVEHSEESHFGTFVRLSNELMTESVRPRGERRPPWSPAYPVLRNPTLHAGNPAREQVTEPQARAALALFNRCYLIMNQLMVQHFGAAADGSLRRSPLMNAALDVMTGMMRPLAEHLVTLPSGRPGRTAGPSFELDEVPRFVARPDVAARSLSRHFAALADEAAKLPGLPMRVPDYMRFYAEFFRT